MPRFPFYTFDSPLYAEDFQALLRCSSEHVGTEELLAELVAPYDRGAVVVDWGAGSGYLTRLLLERFDNVWAVEPSPAQRAYLCRAAPKAHVVPGTLHDAPVPGQVDLGFIRHVFYHVPEAHWASAILRCAARLSARGLLAVGLKRADTRCNAMLEHFGAMRFDLSIVEAALRRRPEYRVERVNVPGPIRTSSFEDTYAIARFMLNDRAPEGYARDFDEEEVREYVRRHLWDEEARAGGWRCDVDWYLVRRNSYWL